MQLYHNRTLVLLVLSILTLSALTLTSAQTTRAQTFEISPITFDPNPGFTCGDTNINFTVTNRMSALVDFISVDVAAKGATGSQQWGSNITMLDVNHSQAMSFKWVSPPAGTYNISVRVIGAGQIVTTSTLYVVDVCGPHISLGLVSFVANPDRVCNNGNLSVEVINDGHAIANDTSVFVSAYGPYPAMTRIPVGSKTVASIGLGGSEKVDFLWTPLPEPGVYSIEVIAIDTLGLMTTSATYVTVPVCPVYDIRVSDISFDPYPGLWGKDAAVNVTVMNAGTEPATSVKVSVSATGPANYSFDSQIIPVLDKGARVKVKFPWLSTLPPGSYVVQVFISSHEFLQVNSSATYVYLAPPSNGTVMPNETIVPRVILSSFKVDPAPGPAGQNVTVRFTITNTGEMPTGVLKVSLAAVGPADYLIGNGTIADLSPGAQTNFTFQWKQPIMPGSYSMYVFWSSEDGSMSSASNFFIELGTPTGTVLQNGTNYYYYYGIPINWTNNGHTVNGTIKLSPDTLNITIKSEKAPETKTTDMAVAGALGAGLGGLISVGGILGVLAMQKGSGQSSGRRWSSDPYSEDGVRAASSGRGGRNSLQESGYAIKEQGVKSSTTRGSLQSSSKLRESPSRPRDSASGQATGKRSGEPLDDDSDGDSPPEPLGMAINEKGLPGDKPIKKKKDSAARTAGGNDGRDTDSDDDGLFDAERKAPRDSASGLSTGKRQHRSLSGEDEDGDIGSDESSKVTVPKQTQGATFGEKMRESPTLPSKGQTSLRESPTKASTGKTSLRESPTSPRDSASGQATGKRSGEPLDDDSDADGLSDEARIRESPTKASTGKTSLRESPTKASTGKTSLRESPTLAPRDSASGQASGKRFGMGGETAPESPLGKSDTRVKGSTNDYSKSATDLKDTSTPESFETGDKPTPDQTRAQDHNSSRSNKTASEVDQSGGSEGPEGDSVVKPEDAGKHTKTGHVTLMK